MKHKVFGVLAAMLLAVNVGAQVPDAVPLSSMVVVNTPVAQDVAEWPVTATITEIDIRSTGVYVGFTKRDGPSAWPSVVPPKWDGPLEYDLWLGFKRNGIWYTGALMHYWSGLDVNGGDITQSGQIPNNWLYSPGYGPIQLFQPVVGDEIAAFVTPSAPRFDTNTINLRERSNVVTFKFPAMPWRYAYLNQSPAPAPEPVPTPTPDASVLDRIAALETQVKDLLEAITVSDDRVTQLESKSAAQAIAVNGLATENNELRALMGQLSCSASVFGLPVHCQINGR